MSLMRRNILVPILLCLITGMINCKAAGNVKFFPRAISGHPEAMELTPLRNVLDLNKDAYKTEKSTQRIFKVKVPDWHNRKIYLWVDYAGACFDLAVNNNKIGRFVQSDYISGSIDVTKYIKPGVENIIFFKLLEISAIKKDGKLLFPAGSWKENTAIKRTRLKGRVCLIATSQSSISHVKIRSDRKNKIFSINGIITANGGSKDKFEVRAALYSLGIKSGEKLFLNVPVGATPLKTINKSIIVTKAKHFSFKLPFPNKYHLWFPEKPYLYIVKLKLYKNGKHVDSSLVRTAIKDFAVVKSNFRLNGKKFIPLMNFSGIGDIYTFDIWRCYKKISKMKKLGYNLYRFHGRPKSRYAYLLCDQIGLPIICEAAIMGGGDHYPLRKLGSSFWNNYAEHVKRMIDQLSNNPSILMWSAGNELLSATRIVDKTGEIHKKLNYIHDLFKSQDPSRPVVFEGDLDLRGYCNIIAEHYPLRYGNFNWPNDFYWIGKPHSPNQADGRFFYKKHIWKKDKPYILSETMWFPVGGPIRHTAFIGDDIYKDVVNYPYAESWFANGISRHTISARAYNMQNITGIVMTSTTSLLDILKHELLNPYAVFVKEEARHYYSGNDIIRHFVVRNASSFTRKIKLVVSLSDNRHAIKTKIFDYTLNAGSLHTGVVNIKSPQVFYKKNMRLSFAVYVSGKLESRYSQKIKIYPNNIKNSFPEGKITVIDFSGTTADNLKKIGLKFKWEKNLHKNILSDGTELLIIGTDFKSPLDIKLMQKVINKGINILVLSQDVSFDFSWLPVNMKIDKDSSGTMAHAPTSHPLFKYSQLGKDDFFWWQKDNFVTKACITKKNNGNIRYILEVGKAGGLTYSPLLEVFCGKSIVMLNQLLCIEKLDKEPVAGELLCASIWYLIDNSYNLKKLALLSPVPKEITGKMKDLGVEYSILNSKDVTYDELNKYNTILIPCEKAPALAEKQINTIQKWVYHNAGRVLFHGVERDALSCVNSLIYPRKVFLRDVKIKRPLFKINTDYKFVVGLSNEILWWIPKSVSSYRMFDGIKEPFMYREVLPAKHFSHDKWKQLLKPAGLSVLKSGSGEFIFDQIRWARNKKSSGKQKAYLAWLMTACHVKISDPQQKSDYSKAKCTSVNIEAFCNQGFKDQTPNDGKGGWFDMGASTDLRSFKCKNKKYKGIDFKFVNPSSNSGKSCIIMKGKSGELFPSKTKPIPVGQKVDYIAFNHAGAWTKDGQVIGTYVIEYTNGEKVQIPVIEGESVLDWYSHPTELSMAAPFWIGSLPKHNNRKIATYVYIWENLKKNIPVKSITIFAGNAGKVNTVGLETHGMLGVLGITTVKF